MVIFIVALAFVYAVLMAYSLIVLYAWSLAYSFYRDDDILTSVALMAVVSPWSVVCKIRKEGNSGG